MRKIYKSFLFFLVCFFSITVVEAATKIAECTYNMSLTGVSESFTISIDDSGELFYSLPPSAYFTAKNKNDYFVNYKNFNSYSDALYKDGKLASTCPRLSLGRDNQNVIWIYYGRESSSLEEMDYLEVQSLSGNLKVLNNSVNVDTRKEKEYCTLSKSLTTNSPISVRFYDDIDGKHMFEVSSYNNKNVQSRAVYNGVTSLSVGSVSYTVFMDKEWKNIASFWSDKCSSSKIFLYTPDGDSKRFYITSKKPDPLNNAADFSGKDDGESYKEKEEEKDDNKKEEKPSITYDKDKLDLKKYCKDAGVARTLKFLGILLYIAKIFVPALIIIFGSIDFGKAILAGKDDEIKKKVPIFIKRFIAGVIVFFIPTIINFMFDAVQGYSDTIKEYDNCYTCILNPDQCNIP